MKPAYTHLISRLELKLHPDPVLRNVCMPIETFDSWLFLDGILISDRNLQSAKR